MKSGQMQEVADVCRMLADPSRVTIVTLVAGKPTPVLALCKALHMRQPNTSHHLGLLRMSGLVRRERKGKQNFYSLNRAKLAPVEKFLRTLK